MAVKYHLSDSGEFVIHDFNSAKPWSSFFPGIAGLFGIPFWVFYVNRGQCIASAGIRSKDEAVMEFLPANKAYQLTPSQGFRTFIKIKDKKGSVLYEPFGISNTLLDARIKNSMLIRPYELSICEENPTKSLKVSVNYFSIVNEPFAGLVRELTIENTSKKTVEMEILDGLSIMIPSGINNWFLKEMSRTIEAWMGVDNIDSGIPIFKLSTDPRDTAQVAFVKGANFYTSFEASKKAGSSKIIVDPYSIFGEVSDFSYPVFFAKAKQYTYPETQVAKNKTPCAFTFLKKSCQKGKVIKLYSVIGHVFDANGPVKVGLKRLDEKFIEKKRLENKMLIENITDRIFTLSNFKKFDLYARQTYLDNVMRGGLPYSVKVNSDRRSVYVYSRKHGDLERDYNRFSVSATYFSEGEGNYRDVNQNRRCDVFFDPVLGEKNIYDFMNLIQLDGYNPLIFKGERFIIHEKDFSAHGLDKVFNQKDANKLAHILSKPFTIGDILCYVEENKIQTTCSLEELAKLLLKSATNTIEASFGEGYWSDHWSYNIDLLESFLSVYPDRFNNLLLERNDFTYYDSAVFVKPRKERYCIQHGQVRQYHAVVTDESKNSLIQKRHEDKFRVRSNMGEGAVFTTTLLDKLICIIANKLATLDPYGTGIEMEADKPNWYDALNGLPGLLGSSINETFELKRLLVFLKNIFKDLVGSGDREVVLTREVYDFVLSLEDLLKNSLSDFDYWDKSNTAKEEFRLKTRRGVSGDRVGVNISRLDSIFELAIKKIQSGIDKGFNSDRGSYTTYFTYNVTKYDSIEVSGKHAIMPKEFEQNRLPLFLEGFVHALRTEKEKAAHIYKVLRNSPLWDKKLKMYKVNASLKNESYEIGRTKAFTPGWLENESIWLHMEYKYLLELLKSGLYKEFYADLATMLIPFQDPAVYGRSILENSSFIVSSVHPDASLHGRGFVARLSGSTAEFIQIWLLMNFGHKPFFLDDNSSLCLRFAPVLSGKFFTSKPESKKFIDISGKERVVNLSAGSYACLFMGSAIVIYKNRSRKDTFGVNCARCVKTTLFNEGKIIKVFDSNILSAPYSQMIRSGQVDLIEIDLI